MELIIIAAMDKNKVIGKDGKIPWHCSDELRKAELKHFRKTTISSAVIMGRKTCESIGRPLSNRLNVVLSKTQPEIVGVIVKESFIEAISYCEMREYDKAFVIGGGSVYREALPLASKMILTEIPGDYAGDTYFPEWNKSEWQETNINKRELFDIITYTRIKKE